MKEISTSRVVSNNRSDTVKANLAGVLHMYMYKAARSRKKEGPFLSFCRSVVRSIATAMAPLETKE